MSQEHKEPAKGKASGQDKPKKKRNPLRNYNILMAVTILVAFLILAFAYSNIIYETITNEHVAIMQRTSDHILENFKEKSVPATLNELGDEDERYLKLAADTSGAVIWLVKPDGELVFVSDIPKAALPSVRIQANGRYYLPQGIRDLAVPEGGLTFTGGNFLGVFEEGSGNWISVVKPFYNSDGRYLANLQLHYRMVVFEQSYQSIINGLLLVILLAILLAVAVVKVYARRMAKPIELLSEAADQVAKGNFAMRVDETWLNDNQIIGAGLPEDDLLILMQTFNRMIEQIERHNTEQRDFIASISHDLRTPLTSIGGFVTAILDGTIPPDRQERYLGIVQDETRRLTALVADMNDAIALDKNNVTADITKFDIYQLISRVFSSLEVLLSAKNISVQTDLAQVAGQTVYVMADETQIERVLYNLISNAVKFVDQDGIIAVSAKRNGPDILVVEVEDNGPGIAEADLPHVFDRFFKGDRSRTDRKGSGLGLYICRRILQNHGQSIFAGRSPMGGARFEFTLPLA